MPDAAFATHRTLFDDADERELKVPTSCRRTGRYRECVVEVTSGAEQLSPPTEEESFLREPYRLACQAAVLDEGAEVTFSTLRRRLQIVVLETAEEPGDVDPLVTVADGVVLYDGKPVEPLRAGAYGVAVDLGTTTLVFELVDVQTGRTLEVVALENPQRFGGSDVMSRISYDEADGRHELQRAVRKAVNRELDDLYARRGIDRREVYEVAVVGNATMRDLFFKLDVSPKNGWRTRRGSSSLRAAGASHSSGSTSTPSFSPPPWTPPSAPRPRRIPNTARAVWTRDPAHGRHEQRQFRAPEPPARKRRLSRARGGRRRRQRDH